MIALEITELSVEFVKCIGQALPQLETLNLTLRTFGSDIDFSSTATHIMACNLNEALIAMLNIKSLSLPSSPITKKNLQILHCPAYLVHFQVCRHYRPSYFKATGAAERLAVEHAGEVAAKLQTMSFVRHGFAEDVNKHVVGYCVRRTIGRQFKVEAVDVSTAGALFLIRGRHVIGEVRPRCRTAATTFIS